MRQLSKLQSSVAARLKRICDREHRQYSTQTEQQAVAGVATDAHTTTSTVPWQVDRERKTVVTAAGDLAVSPLMDPDFLEARERFKQPKKAELPTALKSQFRRHLARNPYAAALATPSRLCPVTRTHLPSFFLQGFKLMAHPETNEPWWIPDGLAAGPRPRGQTAWVLGRQALLAQFAARSRGGDTPHARGHRQLLRMGDRPHVARGADRAVWREDMDALVPELLRRRVVEDLVYLGRLAAEEGRSYLTPLGGWAEAAECVEGSVLWTGAVVAEAAAADADGEGPQHRYSASAPFEEEVARYSGKLAVYNLVELLGEEHWSAARRDVPLLQQSSLILLSRRRTLDLQLKLWKLQGYLS